MRHHRKPIGAAQFQHNKYIYAFYSVAIHQISNQTNRDFPTELSAVKPSTHSEVLAGDVLRCYESQQRQGDEVHQRCDGLGQRVEGPQQQRQADAVQKAAVLRKEHASGECEREMLRPTRAGDDDAAEERQRAKELV
ncbi:hypothetical protein V5799_011247 [Amblyomma americanum]|uniref:Uncharacterized protein n=1 Tax=Amblyomma americanum TaxID=6943 RepID=A0AAQ4EHF3_AMBAM